MFDLSYSDLYNNENILHTSIKEICPPEYILVFVS